MSYPGQLQILIVEDESGPADDYRHYFESLQNQYDLAPPVLARSQHDALDQLNGDRIYHIAIIDLGLPLSTRGVAEKGVEPGIGLVQRAAERDHLPIPCLVIVSGRLG